MTDPPVTVDRWDQHYAAAGPDRPHGNPWRLVDAAETQAHATHAAPITPGARALDVGCGVGDLTATLHQLGYQAHGIDLAPTAINQARTLHPNCAFTCGDITTLDTPAGFDLITARLVLRFLPDQSAFLAQATRLLTTGGRLLILDYLDTDPRAQARGIGLTRQHIDTLTDWSAHVTRYTSQSLHGWLCTPKETSP